MSAKSSALPRQTTSPTATGSMYHSASFAAHLKTLERTIPLRSRYENFIGGQWIAPAKGAYFDNISPTTGQVICQIARSQAQRMLSSRSTPGTRPRISGGARP